MNGDLCPALLVVDSIHVEVGICRLFFIEDLILDVQVDDSVRSVFARKPCPYCSSFISLEVHDAVVGRIVFVDDLDASLAI